MQYLKLILLGIVTVIAAIASSWGHDLAYKVHAFLIMAISAAAFIWVLRHTDEPVPEVIVPTGYADGVIPMNWNGWKA